jgi:hypothetical protein
MSGRDHPFDTSSPPPSHRWRPSRTRRGFERTPCGSIPPWRSLTTLIETRSSRAEHGREDRRIPTYLDGLPVVKRNMPPPESGPRNPSIPFSLTVHRSPATGAVRIGTQGPEGSHPLPANRANTPGVAASSSPPRLAPSARHEHFSEHFPLDKDGISSYHRLQYHPIHPFRHHLSSLRHGWASPCLHREKCRDQRIALTDPGSLS